jgi:uncharacterized protein (DUF1684 family)
VPVLSLKVKTHLVVSIISCTVVLACGNSERNKDRSEAARTESPPVFANADQEKHYIEELLQFRMEKDSFLMASPDSPIKREDRRTFRHLKYYEVNPQFVVKATLHRNESPQHLTITTTTGETRDAVNLGKLEFELFGKLYRLNAYKFTDRRSEGELFVPFTDSTSGHETYGAGRYLDLEENETGEYVLDFNKAYNPYCAYNEEYSCPIPPRENRLSLAVTAGEKAYH